MSTPAVADVDRSTLRLSDVARHIVVPEGIERSLWLGWDGQPGVEGRVHELGYRFDPWQDGLAQIELGVTAAGQFAATVGGIVLSIPRQVAKTFMTMVIVMAVCTMFPKLTVLWTAHRSRLSTQTFGKMKALARTNVMRKYVLPGTEGVRSTNGEQEIRFRNGSVIMFGARERGFGLGFDEVDIEVFDEAQRLTAAALDDMIAATNQSRWSFGALLFFMGTPPRPTDEGEEFTNRRMKALTAKKAAGVDDFGGIAVGGSAVYAECSADPNVGRPGGPALDSRDQVRLANPSYPHRTPEVSIRRLRENLTNDDSWRREGLGVWNSTDGASRAIPEVDWALTGVDSAPVGIRSFGVSFSLDGSRAALAGSVKHAEGIHFEVIDAMSGDLEVGVESLALWLKERWEQAAMIAISGQSWSAALAQSLLDKGVPSSVIHVLSGPEVFSSATMFLDGILESASTVRMGAMPTLTHPVGQPTDHLERSVAVSDKKVRIKTSGAWAWEATVEGGDETPVEASSFAHWASRTSKRDPNRKQILL